VPSGHGSDFKPNQKKPEYDDLVALYQGKELFRYRRF
jgi:hypothetical protein